MQGSYKEPVWKSYSDSVKPDDMVFSSNHAKNQYVGRVHTDDAIMPGILMPAKPYERLFHVAIKDVEKQFDDGEYLVNDRDYHWENGGGGFIPKNAVEGGHLADGTKLYVARAFLFQYGVWQTAYAVKGGDCVYVSDWKAHKTNFYEVLVESNPKSCSEAPEKALVWKSYQASTKQYEMVQIEPSVPQYVGRATSLIGTGAAVVPGKLMPKKQWGAIIHVPLNGEIKFHECEYLVNDRAFCWQLCENGLIPPDAVEGGVLMDGRIVYVARAHSNIIQGGYAVRGSGCFFTSGWKEHHTNSYEVLVEKK